MEGRLRWGIVSSGKICSDFVNAVQHDGGRVVAVCARSIVSARAFAEKLGIERSYDDVQRLADDADVDIVYVGSVNIAHEAAVCALVRRGKHVLCEKPLCLSVKSTKACFQAAKEAGVFLMEAMWSRFTPVHQKLKSVVEQGLIGDITNISVTFGQSMRDVNRLTGRELGGGSVFDIGIYPINLLVFLLGKPDKIAAVASLNSEGLEDEVSASLRFPGGKTGTFSLSTRSKLPNEGFVTGTKGSLKIPNPFWCPERLVHGEQGCIFEAPLDETDRRFNFENSQSLKYEAREVEKCIKEGRTESPLMSGEDSLLLAQVMEDIRAQVGAHAY